ncbi:Collagen and calcium-binding EGF domain-containing protein 1 [Takifugu flavidus]|uniref:Collagen and calcium-binding EGF domain-containing protein 1 n=1 Tax=Takifugu flavidus TaxID=433684 RepID=A0A5C6NHS1_9TELE|nr:Collagen and calcium-binding EGF domain-containing protein 1 [Takifugu flavidus]
MATRWQQRRHDAYDVTTRLGWWKKMGQVVICPSVDYRQHPGEMVSKRGCLPLLLAVTYVCFTGGLMWSFQDEDASDGEECSENNVSTTKYPCVKSTGEAATCYR